MIGRARAAAVAVALAIPAACVPATPPAADGGIAAPAPAGAAMPAPADTAAAVVLRRGECFGACAAYEASVTRGGAVRIVGVGRSASRAPRQASVPADSVAALLRDAERAGWFALRDRYVPGEPGCDRAATDHPSATMTVRVGGRAKTIEHYTGCLDAPAVLGAMASRIDRLAGTDRWLAGGF